MLAAHEIKFEMRRWGRNCGNDTRMHNMHAAHRGRQVTHLPWGASFVQLNLITAFTMQFGAAICSQGFVKFVSKVRGQLCDSRK